MTQRDTAATLDWYRRHEAWPSSLPFDPDGMCLKICRTARNIGAMFPSAISAQQATPSEHRVHQVDDIRQGMVLFFDDPNDSNPFGHIVTAMGRVKGSDRDNMGGIIVRSNSVKSNLVVPVRGSYFADHWGDRFQFAATWLNGVELDLPHRKPKPADLPPRGVRRLEHTRDMLTEMIHHHRRKNHGRIVRALVRDRREINETIRRLS